MEIIRNCSGVAGVAVPPDQAEGAVGGWNRSAVNVIYIEVFLEENGSGKRLGEGREGDGKIVTDHGFGTRV